MAGTRTILAPATRPAVLGGWTGLDLVPGYKVHAGWVRTSEVATRAQVNPQTLRYYERRGLLPSPGRTAGGYRQYDEEAVRIVRFVKRSQELGFALVDVQALVRLADGGPADCDTARELAAEKIADLEAKIADLQAMKTALTRLVQTCQRPRGRRECPILDRLSTDVGTEQPR